MKLRSVEEEACIDQIGELLHAYQKFLLVINEKLIPGELTYSRYVTAVESVLWGVMDNLHKIHLLKDILSGMTMGVTDELDTHIEREQQLIQQLKEANRTAIAQLQVITLNWSRVETSSRNAHHFDLAIEELENLSTQVKNYGH